MTSAPLLFSTIESFLHDTIPTQPVNTLGLGSFSESIGATWEKWTTVFEASLLEQKSIHNASMIGVVEDGLHVALFGLGQIVRQSNLKDPVPNKTVAQVRLNQGACILSAIAKAPLDIAVPIEENLGFRSETFNQPSLPLNFYGTSVSVYNIDNISEKPSAEVGCPFRRNMANLYPKIATLLLDSFQTTGYVA